MICFFICLGERITKNKRDGFESSESNETPFFERNKKSSVSFTLFKLVCGIATPRSTPVLAFDSLSMRPFKISYLFKVFLSEKFFQQFLQGFLFLLFPQGTRKLLAFN